MTLATPEAARSVIDGLQAEMAQCEWRSSRAEAYAACLTAEASKQRGVIRCLKDEVDGSRAREASLSASLQAELAKQRELARLEAEARVHAERSAHLKEAQLDVLEGTVHALESRQRALTAAVGAAGSSGAAADFLRQEAAQRSQAQRSQPHASDATGDGGSVGGASAAREAVTPREAALAAEVGRLRQALSDAREAAAWRDAQAKERAGVEGAGGAEGTEGAAQATTRPAVAAEAVEAAWEGGAAAAGEGGAAAGLRREVDGLMRQNSVLREEARAAREQALTVPNP